MVSTTWKPITWKHGDVFLVNHSHYIIIQEDGMYGTVSLQNASFSGCKYKTPFDAVHSINGMALRANIRIETTSVRINQ